MLFPYSPDQYQNSPHGPSPGPSYGPPQGPPQGPPHGPPSGPSTGPCQCKTYKVHHNYCNEPDYTFSIPSAIKKIFGNYT